MQTYYLWPGTYSFKQELRMLLEYVKEQIDLILFKIQDAERKLNGF